MKEGFSNENNHKPLDVKEKLLKKPKISKLHHKFVNGKNIHFDKNNLSITESHKTIINNVSSYLIILSYLNDSYFNLKDSLVCNSEYNFNDKNFCRIFDFYVLKTPVENVSYRGISFKKRNFKKIEHSKNLEH